MLRLNNRSRSRIKKNKHSKNLEKNTQEKLKYEEDYNEIILNDLVTPEDREARVKGWNKAVKYAYGWAKEE